MKEKNNLLKKVMKKRERNKTISRRKEKEKTLMI